MGRSILLIAGFALLSLAAGCSDDPSKPKDDPSDGYLSPTSIANVLSNLERSYEEMEYDEYATLFDPAFVFVFSPVDTAGHAGMPGSWPLADELASAERLLSKRANQEGYKAYEIHLSFVAGAPVENPPGHPGWTLVSLSSVTIQVRSAEEITGDPLYFEFANHRADLYLAKTGEEWRIVRWEDKPLVGAAPAVENSTWGQIKWIWR